MISGDGSGGEERTVCSEATAGDNTAGSDDFNVLELSEGSIGQGVT